MRRFQNILYATSGTQEETDSLKQALSLARNNATTLQVLAVGPALPKRLAGHAAAYETSLADRIKASIASAHAALQMSPDEASTTVAVECGDTPAVRIVRRVLRNAHDLLVKQAEPTARGWGFRALDMQLLRLCPCPVWLCRPITRPHADMRVGVAVDPQGQEPADKDLALQLLQLARTLADTCSGELSIISCWDFQFEDDLRHSPWAKLADEEIDASIAAAETDHRAALDALIHESGIAGRNAVHRARGRPDRTIPQLVGNLQLDVLVMGTVARTGIPGFVIGNTAEDVLGEIRCSLVAVKPNGFVSPIRSY